MIDLFITSESDFSANIFIRTIWGSVVLHDFHDVESCLERMGKGVTEIHSKQALIDYLDSCFDNYKFIE